jgi:hypothetical protein
MRMTPRSLGLLALVSLTAALATSPGASAQEAATTGTDGEYCVYLQGKTDTPEIGPLPCDTSRRYMIGHGGFGTPATPTVSQPGTDGDAPSPAASPRGDADASPDRSPDVEAP